MTLNLADTSGYLNFCLKYIQMFDIQVITVEQDDFLQRKPQRRKAARAGTALYERTAVSQYGSMHGLPCISEITERKKTSSMYFTPPTGDNILSILRIRIDWYVFGWLSQLKTACNQLRLKRLFTFRFFKTFVMFR